MNASAILLAVLLLSCAFTCCISRDGGRGGSDITISGSSTVMPLVEACAEEFNLNQSDYHVSVSSGGSGVGITNIAQGRSDIAMTSREITVGERSRYERQGLQFHQFLIGYDAICIAVSQDIYRSGVTGLTAQQLRSIYDGKIERWKDVGGPDREILVISRELGSGTRDSFNEMVMGSRTAETPGIDMVAASSAEVTTAIATSDNAIGYLGFSYIAKGAIRGVSYEGIEPTFETISNRSYPLSRSLYFYTFGPPSNGKAAFINYVTGPQGRALSLENGFIPV